jgi:hypothetical protein
VVLGWYLATLARMRKSYPTDLSDAEWSYIEPHLPAPTGHGRPRTHSLREILNAGLTAMFITSLARLVTPRSPVPIGQDRAGGGTARSVRV